MAWSRSKTIPWHPTRKWADHFLGIDLYQHSIAGDKFVKSLGFNSYEDFNTDKYSKKVYEVFGQFAKTFPTEIFNAAMQFPERRWQALCFLSRCPEAIDLFNSNPAILFCVANNWVFHTPAVKNPMRAGRALIKRKQRDILKWLGFSATDKVRRILAKIPTSEITVERLLYLREALNCDYETNVLSHLPTLNKEVLRILCDPRISKSLTYSALEQIANDDHKVSFVPNIINLLSINKMITETGKPNRVLINQVDKIETEYLKLTNQFCNLKQTPATDNILFPSPPYKGSKDIQPLLNKVSLDAEGQAMQNCVATRLNQIMSGLEYIYHVNLPIQATLSVRRDESGVWKLYEIRGCKNMQIDSHLAENIFRRLVKYNLEK